MIRPLPRTVLCSSGVPFPLLLLRRPWLSLMFDSRISSLSCPQIVVPPLVRTDLAALTGLLAPQVGASEVRFPSEPGIGERLVPMIPSAAQEYGRAQRLICNIIVTILRGMHLLLTLLRTMRHIDERSSPECYLRLYFRRTRDYTKLFASSTADLNNQRSWWLKLEKGSNFPCHCVLRLPLKC